jgi:hypothetical protein
MRAKKTIKTTLKVLPFIIAGALSTGETKGQSQYPPDILKPLQNINLFESRDSTPAAIEYNAVEDTTEQKNIIFERLKFNPIPSWGLANCNETTRNMLILGQMWHDVYYGNNLFFNGYSGEDKTEIQKNGGTQKYMGIYGLPIHQATFRDPPSDPQGIFNHSQNYMFKGDTVLPKNLIIIEPSNGRVDVKPGQPGVPFKCENYDLWYNYVYLDSNSRKNYGGIRVLGYKIVNGEFIETYNINNDTTPQYFYDNKPLNQLVHLQMKRKDFGTGIHDLINRALNQNPYPNPTSDYINVGIPQNMMPTKTEIYTADGKKLMESQKNKINVQNLKPGMYIIKSIIGNQPYIAKFVKD